METIFFKVHVSKKSLALINDIVHSLDVHQPRTEWGSVIECHPEKMLQGYLPALLQLAATVLHAFVKDSSNQLSFVITDEEGGLYIHFNEFDGYYPMPKMQGACIFNYEDAQEVLEGLAKSTLASTHKFVVRKKADAV